MKRSAPSLGQTDRPTFDAGRLAGFAGPVVAAGSGRMGRSMAVAFACAGLPVVLLDLKSRDAQGSAGQREQALDEVRAHLGSLARAGVLPETYVAAIAARVSFADRVAAPDVLANARLVLEGVPERLEDKRTAFELIEAHAPSACIVASTTSSFLSTELAAMFTQSARFLNAHWLNPAYLIPVVEVSPHEDTDPGVTDALCAVLSDIGKVPVVCRPSPGYIVPRLQALVMNEAARLVEEGVANAADVDRAVRLGFGLRYASMGVLEFVDYGGVDILHYAAGTMARTISAERYAAPPLVGQLMASGDIGLRSGQGFYDWQSIDAAVYRDRLLARMAERLRDEGLLPTPKGVQETE